MSEGIADADAFAADSKLIEVHVAELRQLFNAMDPSPFHDQDLDPSAAEYIVSWARELPRDAALGLLVHLDRSAGAPDETALLRDAMRQFFLGRSAAVRLRLKLLFRRGRVSLLIGVVFLTGGLLASELLARLPKLGGLGDLFRESLLIGGWVAMWRPLEVFLYDWWPILAEARLFDRLAAMPVHIKYSADTTSDAWRRDWPAAGRAGGPADRRGYPPR